MEGKKGDFFSYSHEFLINISLEMVNSIKWGGNRDLLVVYCEKEECVVRAK